MTSVSVGNMWVIYDIRMLTLINRLLIQISVSSDAHTLETTDFGVPGS
jgi:hypothetical protein